MCFHGTTNDRIVAEFWAVWVWLLFTAIELCSTLLVGDFFSYHNCEVLYYCIARDELRVVIYVKRYKLNSQSITIQGLGLPNWVKTCKMCLIGSLGALLPNFWFHILILWSMRIYLENFLIDFLDIKPTYVTKILTWIYIGSIIKPCCLHLHNHLSEEHLLDLYFLYWLYSARNNHWLLSCFVWKLPQVIVFSPIPTDTNAKLQC